MNRTEVIAAINAKIQEVYTIATEQYHITFSDVKVSYNLCGLSAGRANKYQLCFNIEIATLNFDIFCNEVIPHEIAHIVCARSPSLGYGHNRGWKQVCLSLGGSGSTAHKMVCNYAHGSFLYRTTNGKEVELSKIRHNKIQRGAEYRLRGGGGTVRADGWVKSGVKGDIEEEAPTHAKNRALPPVVMMLNTIASWGSHEQIATVDRLLQLGNKLISTINNIAILTNGKRTVNILANGQREYV